MSAVSTSIIDKRFANVFAFTTFNTVQSKCFDAVYRSDDNFVLSAPTSSGKTVICELAICRLISQSERRSFKIVYQAPTKSLCAERQRDWSSRFATLGLRTAELTGDSHNTQLGSIQHADIIITTPEKWDSITRKRKDHKRMIGMVKLFLLDEVHTLKDDRGAVLEAVVSRMKTLGQSIRFIALSATLPNTNDICSWLGRSARTPTLPARCEIFESSVRPVPLSTHVHGYTATGNHYSFEKSLTSQVPHLIRRYGKQKPVIIFCSTRASCIETAKHLKEGWWDSRPDQRLWKAPASVTKTEDKELQSLLPIGLALHHGGLSSSDRASIETQYIRGKIGVLCCTSTLAAGVNLPCHMVIVKGTASLSPSGLREYSDLEVIQMLGRAGRPQFGDTAVAIIMTRNELVDHYKALSGGGETIESRLHLNLIDHLNAEIVLGTIHNTASAEAWLHSTFLYIRLKQNPSYYGITTDSLEDLESYIKQSCTNGIALLEEHKLVNTKASSSVSTPAGEAMARYYIQFDTMKLFMTVAHDASCSELLLTISKAAEFSDIFLRGNEKQMLKTLDKSPNIRYPLNVHIDAAWQKIYLVIQCSLACAQPPDATANQERDFSIAKRLIDRQLHRLLKCLTECLIHLKYTVALRHALALGQSYTAGAWEDSPLSMSQLDGIGVAGVRKLVSMGVRSIEEIATTESHRLEQTFSRNPPFGSELVKKAKCFPQLILMAKSTESPEIRAGTNTLRIDVEVGFLNEQSSTTYNGRTLHICILAETSDNLFLHFDRISASKILKTPIVNFRAELKHATQAIIIHAMCEGIAGTCKTVALDLNMSGDLFHQTSDIARAGMRELAHRSDSPDWIDDDIADEDLTATHRPDFMDVDDILDSDGTRHRHHVNPAVIDSAERDDDRKLPNRNWRCNHICKNKVTCKHLCCREGLEKAPKPPRAKKGQANNDKAAKPLRQALLSDHGTQQVWKPRVGSNEVPHPASHRHTTVHLPETMVDLQPMSANPADEDDFFILEGYERITPSDRPSRHINPPQGPDHTTSRSYPRLDECTSLPDGRDAMINRTHNTVPEHDIERPQSALVFQPKLPCWEFPTCETLGTQSAHDLIRSFLGHEYFDFDI